MGEGRGHQGPRRQGDRSSTRRTSRRQAVVAEQTTFALHLTRSGGEGLHQAGNLTLRLAVEAEVHLAIQWLANRRLFMDLGVSVVPLLKGPRRLWL